MDGFPKTEHDTIFSDNELKFLAEFETEIEVNLCTKIQNQSQVLDFHYHYYTAGVMMNFKPVVESSSGKTGKFFSYYFFLSILTLLPKMFEQNLLLEDHHHHHPCDAENVPAFPLFGF